MGGIGKVKSSKDQVIMLSLSVAEIKISWRNENPEYHQVSCVCLGQWFHHILGCHRDADVTCQGGVKRK